MEFDTIEKLKICFRCGFIGLEKDFKFEKKLENTHTNCCKECDSGNTRWRRRQNPEKVREQERKSRLNRPREQGTFSARDWRAKHPEKAKLASRRAALSRYKLTEELFQDMLVAQDYRCVICLKVFDSSRKYTAPHIDHDHACCPEASKSCGKCIRGLLCGVCNQFLGRIKDNPEVTDRASDYIRKHGELLRTRLC
jgi:hypothetical protein